MFEHNVWLFFTFIYCLKVLTLSGQSASFAEAIHYIQVRLDKQRLQNGDPWMIISSVVTLCADAYTHIGSAQFTPCGTIPMFHVASLVRRIVKRFLPLTQKLNIIITVTLTQIFSGTCDFEQHTQLETPPPLQKNKKT